LLSTCHALIITCVELHDLCLQLSLELNLQLMFTFSNSLICLRMKFLKQLLSNAFSFLLRVEVLNVVQECLRYLFCLNFLFKLNLLGLVFLYCFFGSQHFELHLFIR
jgi:hypothetical protein